MSLENLFKRAHAAGKENVNISLPNDRQINYIDWAFVVCGGCYD
jgi:hypothetical protein